MNEIGIMQGRLSPPPQGRLQSFPWSSWEEEFAHAHAYGFDAIEWLFEADRFEDNPIWNATGVTRLRRQVASSGTQLRSLCADYFMVHPFFRASDQDCTHSISVLEKLIVQSARVGIRTILVPVLEVSEIRTTADKVQLLECLRRPLDLAAGHGVRLGLETELPASEYRALIEQANHVALGAYYDAGNATAKGFDISADVRALNRHLFGIHIKDRLRGGRSVPFGQGHTDFAALFRALSEVGYTGPIVLQPATDEDYLGVAGRHLRFVKNHLGQESARP